MRNTSFRDPAGFVFKEEGEIYRQINEAGLEDFQYFVEAGLYKKLCSKEMIVPHQEVEMSCKSSEGVKIIKPQMINFISYPYEWSFSQLKDAALLTLEIQKIAMEYGMSLKDASVYNIQFYKNKPIFIDTLSFEKYDGHKPWDAYKQFCQHFLAPLALMRYKDIRLNQLLKLYIDGVPLDLASSLLPAKTYLNYSILTHIHMHSKAQKSYEDKPVKKVKKVKMSKFHLEALLDSIEVGIKKMSLPKTHTEWGDYYNNTNYNDKSFELKKNIISGFIEKINPKSVWDMGANNGEFSRLASSRKIDTIAFDIDPIAVEKNYMQAKRDNEEYITPILLDVCNPSPAIGWNSKERDSFLDRASVDMAMALALIHHLAITNNLPLNSIAKFFHSFSKYLIIEFVPKNDSQVQKMLATREDIFPNYNIKSFEKEFQNCFDIVASTQIEGSERTLYLMKAK